MSHIKGFRFKTICLILVLSGILAACTASPSLPPTIQAMSQPVRTLLTADALTNGFAFDSPVDESALTPSDDSALPTHIFEGRLELLGEKENGHINVLRGELEPEYTSLPEFDFEFVQDNGYLIPVRRGNLIADHPIWNIILEPGRVWQEEGDGDFSRASLPFALTVKGGNATFNGTLTFLFDDQRVSKVWYQVTQETTTYTRADLWGLLDAAYHPGAVTGSGKIRADFAAELAARMPVKPIEALAEEYPGVDVSAFGRGVTPEHMTWYGVAVNGVNYSGGCRTRFGLYPYCEAMRATSYSTAKSAFAGAALMRLAQRYDAGVANLLIKDYVPEYEASAGDWEQVTFNNTLDMATGNYNSAVIDYEGLHLENCRDEFLPPEQNWQHRKELLAHCHSGANSTAALPGRRMGSMSTTNRSIVSILALCVLGGAIFLTMAWISAPAPLSAGAPATDFSAGRAMQDLDVIAREPHPMGISQAHTDVRDYLLGEIRKLRLEPQVQDTFGIRVVGPGFVLGGAVENILVRLPGTDPAGAILLMSHYDSTPGGPGGADSGSGVVTILEILRALQASPPLRQDVIVMFSDGEEPGTIGSHAFVAQHPWLEDVKLAMNTDQFLTGPPLLIRTSRGNGSLIKALAQNAPSTRPASLSLPFHLFAGGDTDLLPFTLAGLPGADIQTTASTPEIHTALDLPRIVDPGSVQQAGNQLLALVRTLGNLPTLENAAPDQTFFPVLGRLIHYPTDWAAPLAIVAGLCFLATIAYGLRKRALTWKGMGLGFLTFVIYLALGVGMASLLWLGIQALHPEYAYSAVRQHLSDDALYALGLFFVVLAVATSTIAVARKKIAALDLAAGALVVWFPVTAATTILIPATSYLGAWALLICSLALLLALAAQSGRHAWVSSGAGFTISAILLVFLWAPVVYQTFLGVSFPMLWMMVGLAAAWLGAMLPALDWITSPNRWLLPAAAALVGLALLVGGHFLVGRDSPPPLVNSIGYWLDADGKEAHWVAFIGGSRTDARTSARYQVAFPEAMDERQSQLLAAPVRRPYTELFPAAPPFSVLTSEAPLLAVDGPGLDVIADQWVGDRRMVQARVTTSLHDRVYVIVPEGSPLLAITVPNNEKTELPPVDGGERVLRFDGAPLEGIDVSFDFSTAGPIQFLVVEEQTGLPSFPGLSTQPEPGTMSSPGEFYQGVATDFTAIYRDFMVQENQRE